MATSATFSVLVLDDMLPEDGESFTVTLTSPSHGSLGAVTSATATIIDDDQPPAAPIITAPTTPTNDATIAITGTAEAGSIVTLTQNGNALTATATVSSTGTWSIEVTLSADNNGSNDFTAKAANQAGNASDASNAVTVTLDQTKPTIQITSVTSPTNTNPIPINLQFSEPPTGFEESDISVSGGVIKAGSYEIIDAFFDGGVNPVRFTITPSGDGTITVSIAADAAQDPATNGNSAASFDIIYDGTAPSVSIRSGARNSGSTVGASTLSYTATFDEVVTDFELSDITVTGSANGDSPVASNLQGTGTSYTFDVVKGSSDGSVIVSIAAGVAMDAAGNPNTASEPYTLTIDTTAPAVAITTTAQTVNEASFTIEGSADTDTHTVELFRGTTSIGSTTTIATNGSWTIPVMLAGGANTITATARDAIGNVSTPSASVIITWDSAPTANAGADQTVAEDAMVTLDGNASSDPEMQPLTYAWTQTSGADVVLSATNTTVSFTAPAELVDTATLTFSLVVNDGNMDSIADTVTITVMAGTNDAPIANAGADQTGVAEGATVTLDGTGSADPEGETLTYVWTHSNTGITLDDATSANPTFTAPENLADNATLTFSLTVTDARDVASVAADTVEITVTAGPNDAPIANAGADQTGVAEGATVTLSGSGTDSEGETLTYAWTQTGGATVALSDVTAQNPTFTAPENLVDNATLTFSLTVTDARNVASVADTVEITVTAGPNDAPIANAGADQTGVAEGVSVTLSGSGTDSEGETLTYAWTQTGGATVALSDVTAQNPTFTAPENLVDNATLTFSLTVTDARNVASVADTVEITVAAGPNDAPIANAGADQTGVAEGATVTLSGSGTDSEGETLTYAWTQTGGATVALSDVTAQNPTFTAPENLVDNATLTFSLTVTDARNVASVADTVEITVTAGPNDAPIANAGADQTGVAEGATVTLSGSGTDSEGETLTYAWTQTGGATVALSDVTAQNPTFTAPENLVDNATLTFSLTVTDARDVASVAADTVEITVTAGPNDAPIANAGADQTGVAEGVSVTLSGSGTDSEGETLTYAWTQTGGATVALSDVTAQNPTFTAPENLVDNATLTFSLTVTDARNVASVADTVEITVAAGPNDAPIANAGADQTGVAEGATVTLSGSGTDSEGETLTYAWTQTGGATVALSDVTAQNPTFTAPENLVDNATLTFSLTVTDARNVASVADTVEITVAAGPNDAPIANAGADQTGVAEGATVTLSGSGTDSEGETLTYAWTQTGGATVALSDVTAQNPTFTAPENLVDNATLTFSLTVTDARNVASVADTVEITVTAGPNDAPIANAGADQTGVAEGVSVTLSGSGTDSEGETLTYAWTQTGGATVALSDVTAQNPTFTAPENLVDNATLTFSLTVTDARDVASVAADTVEITVTAGPNDAPIANAGADQTGVAEGVSVTLSGSGTDSEGETLTYAWTQTGGATVALSDVTAQNPTFTAPENLVDNATLTFSLTVTDARNVASVADTVEITVAAGPNDAPIANAGADQTGVAEGATVTLSGSGTDSEGETLTYAWTQTGGATVALSDVTAQNPTFTAPENLVDNATLTFSLTVTDARNVASVADTVEITVAAGPNDAPIANAGADQTGVAEGATVTLSGSGTDSEGETLTYAWTQTGGATVALSDVTAQNPTFTAPENLVDNATLTFSLTVTDARNVASVADTVEITVTAGPNDAPIANAGADQTGVAEGVSVTLSGSGTDSEGETLTYAWTQTGGATVALSDVTAQNPTFTAPENLVDNATLTFSLTVTDARNVASVADTVEITVAAGPNDAPIANAGADQTGVAEGATVTLSGSGTDSEGETLTYAWTQTGGATVALSDVTAQNPTFTAPENLVDNATLTFSLTVTDARDVASVAADTVEITVTAGPNDAPIANAGADQTGVAEGATVTLSGSGTDSEGETLTYAWTQTGGATVALSDVTAQNPTFTAPENLVDNATLTFSLTVTDARNVASVADTVEITVAAGPNDAPIANAGADQTGVAEGATVTLSGSGTDSEGETLTYAWTQTGGATVALSDVTAQNPTFTAPENLVDNATLTFSLTVTDARNVASVADTVEITVTAGPNDAPIANAGADQTGVAEGVSVTLSGSGTDSEGETLTYAWTQTGGATVALSDVTAQNPTFTAPENLVDNATLTFSLTVTDARNVASVADTVEITVAAGPNDAPIANAGADQTGVAEGVSVTLSGSGTDSEGETLTYAWTQTGGATVALSDVTAQNPTFTAPENLVDNATLTFSLTVTDARDVASVAATVEITVAAGPNDAPIANAGADQTGVAEGATVTLSGSGTDSEGETLTYAWTQTGGATVALSDVTAQNPTFTAPENLVDNATLTFSLTVTDARNVASVADTVEITVTAGPNDAPIANAGADQTGVAEGVSVTLSGSGTDSEGETLTYAWTQTGGATVALSDVTAQNPTFTAPENLVDNATLTFSLTVTDARDVASVAADTVEITVTAGPNDAPIANAGADQTGVAEGVSVTLSGSGTDSEGETLTYAWTQTGGATVALSDVTAQNPTFTAPENLVDNATLTFSLTVTDARNVASVADTVEITVAAGPNDAPIANAGADQTGVAEGVSVTLSGSGTDSEGETLTYAWTQTGGATVALSDVTAQNPTFTAPENLVDNATLTFSLTVTDARNVASVADTVEITVAAGPNDAPIANAGADQTGVAEGATVTLDGTGSSDPEGETLTYAWTHSNTGITLDDATSANPTFTAPENLVDNATLTFSLTVTDARNVASVADTVEITVAAGPNDAPIANAGADQTGVAEGVTVTLDGTGSADPEGETLTYAWTQTGGATVALSDVTAQNPTFTAPANLVDTATLTFELIVTDARMLASVADTVEVTVTATGLTPESAKQLNEEILPRLIHTMLASTMVAVDNRVNDTFSGSPQVASYQFDGQTVQLDSQTSLSANLHNTVEQKLPTYIKALKDDTLDWKRQLGNSAFVMPLNALDEDGGAGAGATVWGSGDYSKLGDENWKGDVFSFQLGVDQRIRKDLLAGGLVSWSKGDVDYTFDGERGEYIHQITSIHPYLAKSYDGINLWGSVGYGQGELSIKEKGDTERRSGTRLLSLAAGVSGRLEQSGQSELNLKSDLALARTNIDGSADGRIPADKLASQRLRLLLEVEQERQLASGGTFKPLAEVGLRYDGGAGNSGIGAILGFGGRYTNTTGLIVEGKLHTLGRTDYQEWGVQGVIRQQADVNEQGLAFSLSPSYGNTGNSANQVWQQELANGNNRNDDYRTRLKVNMGYGLFTGGGLLTPYSELSMGDSNHYRLGLRWKPNSPFNLHLYGERTTSNDSDRILLESHIRF